MAGGDIIKDAFGVVAMVAMTPLITIQIMGAVYKYRTRKSAVGMPRGAVAVPLDSFEDNDIIEL